jgi:hypothetical protein
MYRIAFLVCLLIGSFFKVYGQNNPIEVLDIVFAQRDSQDIRYVRSFERHWSPRLFLADQAVSFGFQPRKGFSNRTQYLPNVSSSIGASIFYRTIGISTSYSPRSGSENIAKLGRTRAFRLGLSIYKIKYGIDFQIANYKGYFNGGLKNRIRFNNGGNTQFSKRSDLNLFTTAFNYFYVDNHYRYSFQAPFNFVKRQIKSSGSLLYMISAGYTAISADSLIPISIAESGIVTGFNKGYFFQTSILPGYAFTLVHNALFFSGAICAGPALQFQSYQQVNRENQLSPTLRANLRASLGYNGDRFFLAMLPSFELNQNIIRGLLIGQLSDQISVQAGYRF